MADTDRIASPSGAAHLLDLSTAELLSAGGDSRHTIGDDGVNRYGCRYSPDPDLVGFGSCTSSTISEVGFAAAERVHGWLRALADEHLLEAVEDLFEGVRGSIMALLARDAAVPIDVVITPSGTDAEFVPLLVAAGAGKPIDNIIVGAAEAGSGTALAAAGLHFDPRSPDGAALVVGEPVSAELAARTTVHRVPIRLDDSTERPLEEIDAEVEALVDASLARGAQPLVHVIAHSKTGVHAPTLEAVAHISGRHPDQVLVVVDAAQGRVSRRGLAESLQRGHMTIISGSKFFGGPPFAGAVLVPQRLSGTHRGLAHVPEPFGAYLQQPLLPRTWTRARQVLPATPNIGLLLRWYAALEEMRDYYLVPSRLRLAVLRTFERLVPEIFGDDGTLELEHVSPPVEANEAQRLLESKTTVFPFLCRDPATGERLDHRALAQLHTLMRSDLGDVAWTVASPEDRQALRCRVLLGQPVRIGANPDGAAVLRIALGGGQIVRCCVMVQGGRTFGDRLARMESEIRTTHRKLRTLLAHRAEWDAVLVP